MSLGNSMLKYLTLTFIIVVVFYGLILYQPLPRKPFMNKNTLQVDNNHHCGPYKREDVGPLEETGLWFDKEGMIYRVLTCVVTQVCLYAFIILTIVHERRLIGILE